MSSFIAVAPLSAIPENGNKAFTVGERSILLCRAGSEVFAVENMCSHARSPLEGGRIRSCHISCPVHGVRFDLRDGSAKGELTKIPIKTYKVIVEDETVKVDLES